MDGTLGEITAGNDFINMFPHGQYCLKYGGKHDDLAPFVINQHRNGCSRHGGSMPSHKVPQLTLEEYLNSRYVLNPLRLWDCDRPVNASARVSLHDGRARPQHAAEAGLCAQSLTAQF